MPGVVNESSPCRTTQLDSTIDSEDGSEWSISSLTGENNAVAQSPAPHNQKLSSVTEERTPFSYAEVVKQTSTMSSISDHDIPATLSTISAPTTPLKCAAGQRARALTTGDEDAEEVTVRAKRTASDDGNGASARVKATHRGVACSFDRAVVGRWKRLASRALSTADVWFHHNIDRLPTEKCKRYRYSSMRKLWTEDMVEVKMQCEPFARGAMRECFRMKKLSRFSSNVDWTLAHNYVGKRYIAETERETIFEDVKLQMDAKLWAEEYNRHAPPKQVDIAQMCVLEYVERNGSPLYHMEHFIEGDYIKYNSNSGFVSSELARQTPHAFSHFSFERSGHGLIVVDIQGVGDLYTDPQIHTADGRGYGDGNLGTKGMALFFHSHACNMICRQLDLSPFDLSPKERVAQKEFVTKMSRSSKTVVNRRSRIESVVPLEGLAEATSQLDLRTSTDNISNGTAGTDPKSPGSKHGSHDENWFDPTEQLRMRTLSMGTSSLSSSENLSSSCRDMRERHKSASATKSSEYLPTSVRKSGCSITRTKSADPDEFEATLRADNHVAFDDAEDVFSASAPAIALRKRLRHCSMNEELPEHQSDASSECEILSVSSQMSAGNSERGTSTKEEEREAYWAQMRQMHRPSHIMPRLSDKEMLELEAIAEAKMAALSPLATSRNPYGSVLGQVHLDMCRYHELGRFVKEDAMNAAEKRKYSSNKHDDSDGSDLDNMDMAQSVVYDRASAWFHLEMSAECNVLEAVLTIARIYLGLGRDLLKDFDVDSADEDNVDRGLDMMQTAAECGDRSALLYMADSYESGMNLGSNRSKSYLLAAHYYERALGAQSEEEATAVGYTCTEDTHPRHALLAKLAQMYGEGEFGLTKSAQRAGDLYNEAAEAAMEAMKGKLATKYYMMAEERYGEMEEEEE